MSPRCRGSISSWPRRSKAVSRSANASCTAGSAAKPTTSSGSTWRAVLDAAREPDIARRSADLDRQGAGNRCPGPAADRPVGRRLTVELHLDAPFLARREVDLGETFELADRHRYRRGIR